MKRRGSSETQISAYVSEATRDALERYSKAHGVKKGHLLEEALLHHMRALQELPADLVIPPKIVLTAESFARVVSLIERPRRPTKAMRELMAGKLSDEVP